MNGTGDYVPLKFIQNLDVNLSISEIYKNYKKYNVIQLRKLVNDIFIIGCGQVGQILNIKNRLHQHNNCDTIDLNLEYNPSVCGNFMNNQFIKPNSYHTIFNEGALSGEKYTVFGWNKYFNYIFKILKNNGIYIDIQIYPGEHHDNVKSLPKNSSGQRLELKYITSIRSKYVDKSNTNSIWATNILQKVKPYKAYGKMVSYTGYPIIVKMSSSTLPKDFINKIKLPDGLYIYDYIEV